MKAGETKEKEEEEEEEEAPRVVDYGGDAEREKQKRKVTIGKITYRQIICTLRTKSLHGRVKGMNDVIWENLEKNNKLGHFIRSWNMFIIHII